MSILHVRNVPDPLYQRLQALAQRHHRSLSAQVVELLSQGVTEEEQRLQQAAALDTIRRRRFTLPEGAANSLDLLHEDRNR